MDLNKNFENATVTIPYNDFVKCLMAASIPDPGLTHIQQAGYINDLVEDFVNGKIPLSEAREFAFFHTKLGEFIIMNIENFKPAYAKKSV